ncbi:hypothetical protein HDU86_002588 [Geranomyces michiganensis]|nr:hypothetical protein HDU86_002588 [Geranomyces michiganensis]
MVIQTADFYTDRKGDKQNLLFAKSDTYAIPSYRRWGDLIIGASANWRIDHRASRKNRDLVITMHIPRDSNSTGLGIGNARYQDFKRLLQAPPSITLEKLQSEISSSDTTDFIGFALPSAAGPHEPVVLNENADYTRKTAELNAKLHGDSKDLKSWLALVSLQDELVRSQEKKGGIRAAVYEKQQAIYERALREMPENEMLLAGYMRVCQETWETTALLTKWDSVLKTHGHSVDLWKQYLDFRQTSYSAFTVSSCLDTYETCIRAIDLGPRSAMSVETREELLLHVFARACAMLSQAGFIERAVASYQAMIEFTCFCPPAFASLTFAQRMGMFEEWWEGEASRFGERDAKGWAGSVMGMSGQGGDDGVAGNADPDVALPPLPEEGEDAMESFAAREAHSEFYGWLPRRGAAFDEGNDRDDGGDEDDADDDPYRTIVFDDVSTLMFAITLPASRARLIHSFLHFLSVPFDGGVSSNAPFWQDVFLHSGLAHPAAAAHFWPAPPPPTDSTHGKLLTLPDAETAPAMLESDPFGMPLKTYPQSATTTVVGQAHSWFRKWTPADADGLQARGYDRPEFVRNALRQLAAAPDTALAAPDAALIAPLLLAFESAFSVKRAQKVAKGLLKDDRMNLALWNAYAQLDLARDKPAEARRVYETALTSCRSAPAHRRGDAPLLYRMLAYLEFEQGHGDAALHVLAAFALDEPLPPREDHQLMNGPPSPTTLLRARNAFTQLINTELGRCSQDPNGSLIHIVACAALTEYLAHGLDDARRVYDRVLEGMAAAAFAATTTSVEELLWMEQARLVRAHATSGAAFVPATLRGVLERALDRVPSNLALWTLYGWNEARTKIENRVRARVETALIKNPSHTLRTFAIWAELHQRQTYNPHAVRSLFEDTAECPSSRHSVSLWHLYIQFELREGNGAKAKSLVYRALQACPWCKDLYMLPFRPDFRPLFRDDELSEMIALMDEKELRVRTSV